MRDDEVVASVLERRYSCRGFLSDVLPPETLQRLFAMAQRTASWCNSQAWEVHLTSGEQTRMFAEALQEWVQTHPAVSDIPPPQRYEGVYLARRRAAGHGLYGAVGVARGDNRAREQQALRNFRFFGAPHVAVISAPKELGVYGAVDGGGYVATLLLSAESLGLAAIAQAAIAMHSDFVHAYLGISDTRNIVCAVSFGLADPAEPANRFRTDRAQVADVVTQVQVEPRPG